MALNAELEVEYIKRWLEEIATNTAATRDAVMGRGGSGAGAGSGGAAPALSGSRMERVIEALGNRFESSLSKLRNTPAEKVVNMGLDRAASMLEGAANSLLNTSRGLANRGFSGTLERARFDFAMEQLSRQFAAIMMPLMSGMTFFAVEAERRLRSLSSIQQDSLLGTGLGAVIGGRIGGLPGMIAGGIIGNLAGSNRGQSETDGLKGMAAGALMGARLGPYGALAGAGAGYVMARGDYGALQKRGNDEVTSGLGAAGAALGDLADFGYKYNPFTAPIAYAQRQLGVGTVGGSARAAMGVSEPELTGMGGVMSAITRRVLGAADAGRTVTPYSADPLAAGGTADAIQKAMIRATAGAEFEENNPLKPFLDLGLKIFDVLLVIASGGTYTPPPTPAAGS